jgi:hypothetical protein
MVSELYVGAGWARNKCAIVTGYVLLRLTGSGNNQALVIKAFAKHWSIEELNYIKNEVGCWHRCCRAMLVAADHFGGVSASMQT